MLHRLPSFIRQNPGLFLLLLAWSVRIARWIVKVKEYFEKGSDDGR